jgi:lipoate---protein ligase
MLCIFQKNFNPYFNIAAEEYFLRQFNRDIFIIYRNEPSVIVGKHQNTLAEVDYGYAQEHGIKIVRRLSGGGAVYHDLGNVNFTFIRNGEEGKLVDFRRYANPIIKLLSGLGIEAKFEGHNSLTINGKKFSGNAEHVYKNRVMHHGTMLYSSNLEQLAKVLYVNPNRYSDKAVKSVRATTTNICEHLARPFIVDEFALFAFDGIVKSMSEAEKYCLTEHDNQQINGLIDTKYATWEWNFGYSPTYTLSRNIDTQFGFCEIEMQVEKGRIASIDVKSTNEWLAQIANALLNAEHRPDCIIEKLSTLGLDKETANNLANKLF